MNTKQDVAITNPEHIKAFRLFSLIRGARLES